MRANYTWGWKIYDDGYRAVDFCDFTDSEKDKARYVNKALNASVHDAECGWHGVAYCVCDVNGEDRREYVMMFGSETTTPNGARWIDVTCDSKGAIAEAVWSLVFA